MNRQLNQNYIPIAKAQQDANQFCQDHWYTTFAMLFVACLLTANILGPKPILVAGISIPAGLIIFPFSYAIVVIITEIYGFKASRRVIYVGLACNILLAISCKIAISLPSDSQWQYQTAYAEVLGLSTWLIFCSITSYFIGELTNSTLVVYLKQSNLIKKFWPRALIGNWIGETVETCVFLPLAFYQLPLHTLIEMITLFIAIKASYSSVLTPFIQIIVTKLSKKYKTIADTNSMAKIINK